MRCPSTAGCSPPSVSSTVVCPMRCPSTAGCSPLSVSTVVCPMRCPSTAGCSPLSVSTVVCPVRCPSTAGCSPPSVSSSVVCPVRCPSTAGSIHCRLSNAALLQVAPSFYTLSSCRLLLGRPLHVFPLRGCHCVHRLVLLSLYMSSPFPFPPWQLPQDVLYVTLVGRAWDSSSAFPAISLGLPFLGETFCVCDRFSIQPLR